MVCGIGNHRDKAFRFVMFLVLSLSDLVNIPMKVLTWGVSSATGAPNISFLQVATAEPVQEATVPYQQ